MKALLVYILLAVFFFVEIRDRNTYTLINSSARKPFTDSIPTDTNIVDFNNHIKPIFVSRCSPCHFTGGKMYGRLPFDKDTTIVAHGEAILRRIKDEKEVELIKHFIQQQSE